MIYPLTLETALLIVGLLLIAGYSVALVLPQQTQTWLKAFPRSGFFGTLLLAVAAIWFFWLVTTMDLGEFDRFRKLFKMLTPVAAILTGLYVQEFLAARSLGMIVLLGAEALLEAAWLRPEMSRLWLVSLVYVWLTAALFWVGMPYTLRDQIAWVSANATRWKIAAISGIVYGVILIAVRLSL